MSAAITHLKQIEQAAIENHTLSAKPTELEAMFNLLILSEIQLAECKVKLEKATQAISEIESTSVHNNKFVSVISNIIKRFRSTL